MSANALAARLRDLIAIGTTEAIAELRAVCAGLRASELSALPGPLVDRVLAVLS